MKPNFCRFVLATLCALFTVISATAQDFSSIRQKVIRDLSALKPKNSQDYRFKVIVPTKPRGLPENIRLDLVYKIGHYDFEYVALRFERRSDDKCVNVTYFSYGSALDFWKEWSEKGTTYTAKQAVMPVEEFDKLMMLAVTYFDSEISSTPIIRSTRGKGGSWSYRTTFSMSYSSSDGHILVNTNEAEKWSKPIIEGNGSLVANVKSRALNGYNYIRPNLFWNVFHDYLEKNNIFRALQTEEAERIAIARLAEPNLSTDYGDYYRQSAFVEFLGANGTRDSLPILEKVSKQNGLEKDWDKYLFDDAQAAIAKIKSRL
jgi:hypothetical protein